MPEKRDDKINNAVYNAYLLFINYSFFDYTMPKGKPKIKTAMMTMRVDPLVKLCAELGASRERRSVTNFIEVLVMEYCEQHGLKPGSGKNKE